MTCIIYIIVMYYCRVLTLQYKAPWSSCCCDLVLHASGWWTFTRAAMGSKISSRSHMYAVKTSHVLNFVLNSMENVGKVPFKVDTENNLLISPDKSCDFETWITRVIWTLLKVHPDIFTWQQLSQLLCSQATHLSAFAFLFSASLM